MAYKEHKHLSAGFKGKCEYTNECGKIKYRSSRQNYREDKYFIEKILQLARSVTHSHTEQQIFVTRNLWKITALQERRIIDVQTNMDFRFKSESAVKEEVLQLRRLEIDARIA